MKVYVLVEFRNETAKVHGVFTDKRRAIRAEEELFAKGVWTSHVFESELIK